MDAVLHWISETPNGILTRIAVAFLLVAFFSVSSFHLCRIPSHRMTAHWHSFFLQYILNLDL